MTPTELTALLATLLAGAQQQQAAAAAASEEPEMGPEPEFLRQRFDLNDATGCFLGCVGLVYALVFAAQV